MNNYDKSEMLKLLDGKTVASLLRIYGLNYKHLAVKFGLTRPAIFYQMKHGFKDYQLAIIYELFSSHGMENLELILIHQMLHKRKKVKA